MLTLDIDLPEKSLNAKTIGKSSQQKLNSKVVELSEEQINESIEIELRLPSPHPLSTEQTRIIRVPIRYAFQVVVSYLYFYS